ncbi:hypothetical protein IG631_14615 [Alternaria alternata]|nr:hypothetical protein IG631_14615 [Alternaria alternata]
MLRFPGVAGNSRRLEVSLALHCATANSTGRTWRGSKRCRHTEGRSVHYMCDAQAGGLGSHGSSSTPCSGAGVASWFLNVT